MSIQDGRSQEAAICQGENYYACTALFWRARVGTVTLTKTNFLHSRDNFHAAFELSLLNIGFVRMFRFQWVVVPWPLPAQRKFDSYRSVPFTDPQKDRTGMASATRRCFFGCEQAIDGPAAGQAFGPAGGYLPKGEVDAIAK